LKNSASYRLGKEDKAAAAWSLPFTSVADIQVLNVPLLRACRRDNGMWYKDFK
jgi:hypothetical protein